MAPITGATSIQAYQREASRLATATPRLSGKAVTRDTAVSIGPFSVRYTATDYEFDPLGTGLSASFADALDAANQTQRLAETSAASDTEPNALTTRQALAGYQAAQRQTEAFPGAMLSLTI